MREVVTGPEFEIRRFLAAFSSALAGFGLLASVVVAFGAASDSNTTASVRQLEMPHVVILKDRRQLLLFDGDTLVRTYPVDLGTTPLGQKIRAGDGRTPEGSFRIVTKNAESAYHRFLGLSYPGPDAVTEGLSRGLLSTGEAAMILDAATDDRPPPWRTPLGGGIGIHGHHRGHDWTGGCAAVSDDHVEELFAILRLGDPVEILP